MEISVSLPKPNFATEPLRLRRDLEQADEEASGRSQVNFRLINHLAELGGPEDVRSPHWLKLTAAKGLSRVDQDDFRDEMQVTNYSDNSLRYELWVAGVQTKGKKHARWVSISELVLNSSVASRTCDQRLHFHHVALQPN